MSRMLEEKFQSFRSVSERWVRHAATGKYEKLLMRNFSSFFLKFHLSDKKEIEVNMLT